LSFDRICCSPLPTSFPVPSPFGRFLSLGYYDGSISGVAQCSQCLSWFRYDVVAWDAGQDVRVFSIARLPLDSLEAIVNALSTVDPPRWPIWAPKLSSLTPSETSSLSVAIREELSKSARPTHVLAAYHIDKEILGAKELTDDALHRPLRTTFYPTEADWAFWRKYLGIAESLSHKC